MANWRTPPPLMPTDEEPVNDRRNSILWAIVVAPLAIVVALAAVFFWPEADVSAECFEQVEVGKSFPDVARVLDHFEYECRGMGPGLSLICERPGSRSIRLDFDAKVSFVLAKSLHPPMSETK